MRKQTKKIPFSYAFELLAFALAAEKNKHVGALGEYTVEELLKRLDFRVKVELSDSELEHLIYVYKQAVLNKVDFNLLHSPVLNAPLNYNLLLEKIAAACPDLFVISNNGEVKESEQRNR